MSGAHYANRVVLITLLGPGRCPTCLERYGSDLHHQLCEVNA